ncbi:isochorismate synthase [Roseomonas aerophila]|uniref:isochorismate synthase n=1 Tax=Teichococcus aerophilus TaxID=1224513 RepID=A0ABR7RPF8_9PROT|nr:isochorismate synthase [Pseudoroseomonas aerophila]MBC9207987.1 isochorismate synthase [Pseudoroseomonas aerophila]
MSTLASETHIMRQDGMEAPLFAFRSARGVVQGQGLGAALPRGPAETLGARVAAFFRLAGRDALLAGALPFAREAEDYLVQPRTVSRTVQEVAAAPRPDARWQLAHEPDAAGYAASVQRALGIMRQEAAQGAGRREVLTKIVLSRSLLARADAPIDLQGLLRRLSADPSVTGFLVPLPPRGGAPRVLAGATPELLLSKTGARILSHPLAGSARREVDAAADSANAAALARSDKDRREHAIVADFILDTLAPYCRQLSAPQGTTLTSTNSMWHLGTRIEGELKDASISSAELAAALHPTPAVCGLPRAHAARLIGEIEAYDRDFYAGAVGWCDAAGDGAWYVSIRCAEIAGNTARLYAGAGIVPGSDPWAEAAETGAKYGALLAALGIELEETRL